ncbi:hypothetical protein [Pelagibacterium luteolum]|uniref:Uncharacterized protein n=1 Tax=Pelagibacterium luteolum TaxID=440168 RepID=A0A1G7Y3Y6_9HYPH|nr:hypothetical protein [Pelagibacterium luteolum]SDG90966.1 hypothetical protein SAMN04487974_11230 [Pelagibacterium luteolum]
MGVTPELAELEATILRMEARFDAEPSAAALMAYYRQLSLRFADDLTDPRDIALSRAAALMMVKAQQG